MAPFGRFYVPRLQSSFRGGNEKVFHNYKAFETTGLSSASQTLTRTESQQASPPTASAWPGRGEETQDPGPAPALGFRICILTGIPGESFGQESQKC